MKKSLSTKIEKFHFLADFNWKLWKIFLPKCWFQSDTMYTLLFTIINLGALFPWRYAVGIVVVVPVTTFFLLFFCPESPIWLISQGREEEAKNALTRLRGADNMDIIQAEFNRISNNLKIIQSLTKISESEKSCWMQVRQFFSLLIDPSFVKPFSYLLVMFVGGEWTGIVAYSFYTVPLLMYVLI